MKMNSESKITEIYDMSDDFEGRICITMGKRSESLKFLSQTSDLCITIFHTFAH